MQNSNPDPKSNQSQHKKTILTIFQKKQKMIFGSFAPRPPQERRHRPNAFLNQAYAIPGRVDFGGAADVASSVIVVCTMPSGWIAGGWLKMLIITYEFFC